MSGSCSIRLRASDVVIADGNTPPRIAPRSRMWRTSARVSTSVIAGIAWPASQLSHPWVALGASSRSTAARMIAARACTRSDSMAGSDTP